MLISVDVEADGPYPGDYSMVCFGAVVVEPGLERTFYGQTAPISDAFIPEALRVSGFSRTQHSLFEDAEDVIPAFSDWLSQFENPRMISDNPAFDWQWINYYLWKCTGANPFGHSARRIGDLYCGMRRDLGKNREWKRIYRQTAHDHNPLNDAIGNAEALLYMWKEGLKGVANYE